MRADVQNDPLDLALDYVRIGRHAEAKALLGEMTPPLPKSPVEIEQRPSTPDDVRLLRRVTLEAEIAEHDGNYARAKEILDPYARSIGAAVEETLRARKSAPEFVDDNKRRVLRQELYFLWQLSVSRYREPGHVDNSRDLLHRARKVAEQMENPSEGLLIQLYYGAGKIAFHDGDFVAATQWYQRSLSSAARRIHEKRLGGEEDTPTDRAAARYSIAKALALGLGQTLREQGRFEDAYSVVVAGGLLLDLTRDVVLRNHSRMLLGSIERGAAGETTDPHRLKSARANLEHCASFFTRDSGDPWFRAHYELGLAKMQQGEIADAREEIDSILKTARQRDEDKWIANGQIAMSRIARRDHRHAQAVKAAEDAEKIAKRANLKRLERRANITLAIARYHQAVAGGVVDRGLLQKAKDAFKSAEAVIAYYDTRNQVMLRLVAAQIAIAEENFTEALHQYRDSQKIGHWVEGGRVRETAAEVREALQSLLDHFHAPIDSDDHPQFEWNLNILEFERYLIDKAKREVKNEKNSDLARKLGISERKLKLILQSQEQKATSVPRRKRRRSPREAPPIV